MRKLYYWINREPNDGKFQASLLELFFDLIFVALIGGFVNRSEQIFEEKIFSGFEFGFVTMVLITGIMIWGSFTVYSSRYEDVYNYRHRIFAYLMMLGMSIVTAALFVDFQATNNFNIVMLVTAIGFWIAMTSLLWLHISAGIFTENKYERRRQFLVAGGILFLIIQGSVGAIKILIDDTFTNEWTFISLWAFGIVGLLVFIWFASTGKIAINTKDTSLEHLQERTGVIFIVFMGESVIQTISGSSTYVLKDSAKGILEIFIVFTILFCWWWWFNDIINYLDIVNHPLKITIYKHSMTFMLIALSFAAIGLSGTIKDSTKDYPKYMLGAGIIIWTISNTTIFFTLKEYNRIDKVAFPRFINVIIYTLPLWSLSLTLWFAFPSVTDEIYLYIILFMSLLMMVTSIAIRIYKNKKIQLRENYFDHVIEEYYAKEIAWIKKYAEPKLDKKVHEKYKYKLNHFSKFLIE